MSAQDRPLADLLRPQLLEDIVGQDHLFGERGALATIAQSKNIPSLVLWGPAGVGKTSVAKILAKISGADFVMLSAINSGAADIRKIVDAATKQKHFQQEDDIFAAAKNAEKESGDGAKNSDNNSSQASHKSAKRTILMIDEIHHFNKTQQDLFLPFIEDGTIILIATTTENPSFHLNSALLSRCKVLTLKSLDDEALKQLLLRSEEFLDKKLPLDDEARETLISLACGDARYLLNACEELFGLVESSKFSAAKNKKTAAKQDSARPFSRDELLNLITKRSPHFDKKGEFHYNLISAFHKSLRGSDVDAALYYLARMLVAKEDPYYILRRLARFATEDIGIADPQALVQVMMAKENYDFLGSPEGDYALSHAVIYCATAPKSNASYMAHKAAIQLAQASTQFHPPKHILNAPTKMMKEQGFGVGYIYDHDTKNCFSGQEYFPDEISKKSRPKFYQPNERGFERDIKKRLEYWDELKNKLNK